MSGAESEFARYLQQLEELHYRSPQDVLIACQTLLKYVNNIAENPKDEKYRRIRLSNDAFSKRVGRFQEACRFLKHAGFVTDGDFYVLPTSSVSTDLLHEARNALELRIAALEVKTEEARREQAQLEETERVLLGKRRRAKQEEEERRQTKLLTAPSLRGATSLDADDSRATTGFVGLRNQGATCYLNSLLQTLFHLSAFRLAVYSMPVPVAPVPSAGAARALTPVPLALQRLFFALQGSPTAVATRELTDAFGWERAEVFQQHDVQELCRVLLDNLDAKMLGTDAEGTMRRLFCGRVEHWVRCRGHVSRREEEFFDLSLSVRGAGDVYGSFEQMLAPEELTGDNKYDAGPENGGLQDATRGTTVLALPPVLMLHLIRFAFDPGTGQPAKINDVYRFSTEVDLTRYVPAYAGTREGEYVLYAVLVHAGGVHGGHYFSFIRTAPAAEGAQWLRFDDSRVTRATAGDAVDANYGGSVSGSSRSWGNAYMLVYVRRSVVADLLFDITPETVPAHLLRYFEEESAAAVARQRAEEEARAFCRVALAASPPEPVLCPDMSDLLRVVPASWRRVPREASVATVLASFAHEPEQADDNVPSNGEGLMHVPEEVFAVWAARSDGGLRRVRGLDLSASMDALCGSLHTRDATLVLYPHHASDAAVLTPVYSYRADRGVYFHAYAAVESSDTPASLRASVPAIASHGPVYVVATRPRSDSRMPSRFDTRRIGDAEPLATQTSNGDGVVFEEETTLSFAEFLTELEERVAVQLVPRATPALGPATVLSLRRSDSYLAVEAALRSALDLPDDDQIRLTGHQAMWGTPRPRPFTLQEVGVLGDMLPHAGPASDILYFETIAPATVTVVGAEARVVVRWRGGLCVGAPTRRVLVRVPASSVARDVAAAVANLVGPDETGGRPLRLLQICNNRVERLIPAFTPLSEFSADHQLWAEPLLDGEHAIKSARVVPVSQFLVRNGAAITVDAPFLVLVVSDMTLAELRSETARRFGADVRAVEKMRVCVLRGTTVALQFEKGTDKILAALPNPDDALGIELAPGGAAVSGERRTTMERALTIRT